MYSDCRHREGECSLFSACPRSALGIAFFDLDDTLIPTDWIRRAFTRAIQQRAATVASAQSWPWDTMKTLGMPETLCPMTQAIVRAELEHLGGADFDERAAGLVESACDMFGVVVIVTNARSSVWLQVMSSLFPRFKAQLRRFSVPILRAAAAVPRRSFGSPLEYFRYWTQLKKVQFGRVITTVLDLLTPSLEEEHEREAPFQSYFTRIRRRLSDVTSQASTSTSAAIERELPATSVTQEAYTVEASFSSPTSRGRVRVTDVTPFSCFHLSPRSHCRESEELEVLLTANESAWVTPFDAASLCRILAHQIRRYLLRRRSRDRQRSATSSTVHSPRSADAPYPYGMPSHEQWVNGSPRTWRNKRRKQLEIVCVGDSEFELCAARELAEMDLAGAFHGCGLVKCKTGLSPDHFGDQLFQMGEALRFISALRDRDSHTDAAVCRFGPTVIAEYTTYRQQFRTRFIGTCSSTSVLGVLDGLDSPATRVFGTPCFQPWGR